MEVMVVVVVGARGMKAVSIAIQILQLGDLSRDGRLVPNSRQSFNKGGNGEFALPLFLQ